MSTKIAPVTMIVAGGLVVLNAWAANQYCVMHSQAVSCNNPIAPGPSFPGKGPQPPAGPIGTIITSMMQTTGTISAVTGAITR